MRWPARRWLRVMLTVALPIVLALGAAFTWLVTTEAGLRQAIAMVESLDSVSIRVTGARGRLIGPLSADAVDIEHEAAIVRVSDFVADYEPSEIFAGRISAEGLRAESVTVQLREHERRSTEPAFLPGWLTISLDEASVGSLAIRTISGTELRLAPVTASVTMTRSKIEFEGLAADAPNWSVAGASGLVLAREPLALQANAAWSVLNTREIAGVLRAMGNLDRLLVEAHFAAPAIGRADLELTDLVSGLHWRGKAAIETLDLARWIKDPPFGPLRGEFDVSGDVRQYAASGVVKGNGLPAAGAELDAAASYADQLVTIEKLVMIEDGGAEVRLDGTFAVREEPAFDLHASWTKLRWPLTGSAVLHSPRGEADLRGWREFDYQLAGDFTPRELPPVSGGASGRFASEEITVTESAWRTLDGRITAKGSLGRGDQPAWALEARARGINPAGIRRELPGRLDFDFRGNGSGFGNDAPWVVTIANLRGRFRGQAAGGGGTVRNATDRMEFESVALTLGTARLQLDGALGEGRELEGQLVADDLSALLPELGGRVDATLRLRERSWSLAMTAHDLAWGSHRATILSGDAHVDLDDREFSWVRLRSNGLVIAGFALTDTRLSLDGLLRDHAVEFRVGAGEDAVTVSGRGAYVDSRFTLRMQDVTATGPRTPTWKLDSPSRLAVSARDAELEPACIVAGARRICVEGRWNDTGNWSFRGRTENFPLDTLSVKAPGAVRYHGLLSIDARASARSGEPWLADAHADIRDGVLEYESASGKTHTVPMGRTTLAITSTAERHSLDLRVFDAADTSLTAELVATRAAGLPLGELPVTGKLHGATQQLGLLPLLFTGIDQAAGIVQLDLDVSGRLTAPELAGQVRLSRGALDFYQANLRLRELEATVALQRQLLELKATGKAGGGTMALDGRFGWQERRVSGVLTMKGERLLLADVPEAKVFASPDLRFALDDRHIAVTGTITIPEASITPAETAGAVLVSTDERVLRPELEDGGERGFQVESDVRIVLGDKVHLDAYGLTGRIGGSVHTRTAPQQATVASGEFQVREGEYRAYTRELKVERGRLLFTGGPVTDPGIDLRASQRVDAHTVGVIARGRLRQPQLTLFSEPPLPQAQIASLLIVGRSLDNLQDDDRDALASQEASLAAQGGAYLAGRLGKYVGLDEAGIVQDSDEGSALVLGKYLSPRLYVSYGISLVDQINTLKLRYTIGDRWVISAEAGREAALDIEYSIEQ